jgi:hypothetical protein
MVIELPLILSNSPAQPCSSRFVSFFHEQTKRRRKVIVAIASFLLAKIPTTLYAQNKTRVHLVGNKKGCSHTRDSTSCGPGTKEFFRLFYGTLAYCANERFVVHWCALCLQPPDFSDDLLPCPVSSVLLALVWLSRHLLDKLGPTLFQMSVYELPQIVRDVLGYERIVPRRLFLHPVFRTSAVPDVSYFLVFSGIETGSFQCFGPTEWEETDSGPEKRIVLPCDVGSVNGDTQSSEAFDFLDYVLAVPAPSAGN